MPVYKFKAMDGKGQTIAGESGAQDVGNLTAILKEQGLFLIEAKVSRDGDKTQAASAKTSLAAAEERSAVSTDKVPVKDVAIFTTELTIMVRTALPILEALQTLAMQQPNPVFKSILSDIAGSVRRGQSLSKTFARYPSVFDEVYVSLLTAGEASGNLALMLERLSGYLNFKRELKSKIQSALIYPLIVVATTVIVVSFLVLFILPIFAEVFAQFETALPLPTRMLIFVSNNVRRYWFLYLGGSLGLSFYIRNLITNPVNTKALHAFELRFPVAGNLVRNVVMTRVLRTLGTLVGGGVPILYSLELAGSAAGNLVFSEILDSMRRSAAEGRGLASALVGNSHIPQIVTNMISTAEKTGTLPEVLNKLADYYQSETDQAIKDLFAVMEPAFVLGLGLMVGGVAIAVLLPIFELSSNIQ